MQRHTSLAMVGLFVLIAGLALVSGVLWLTVGEPGVSYQRYYADMQESISGLTEDAAVTYRGMAVGRVVAIGLDPDNPQEVRLTLEIETGTPIKADTVAVLQYQGVTGVAVVDLTGGTLESEALLPTDDIPIPEIRTGPSLLVRLDEGVSKLIASVTETSDRMQVFLDAENQENVRQTLADLRDLIHTLKESSDELEAAIADAASTFESTTDLGVTASEAFTDVQSAAQAFEQMSVDLETTSKELRAAVDAGREDTLALIDTTEREIRSLSTDLRRLAEQLERLAASLEEDPSRVIYGPEEPEPGPGEGG